MTWKRCVVALLFIAAARGFADPLPFWRWMGCGVCLVIAGMAVTIRHAEPLLALLRESKRQHYHSINSYYCCPKCNNKEEHPGLEEGETVGSVSGTAHDTEECVCGVDAWNARVDALLRKR